jgi:uncharacterized membrane protein
MPTTRIEAFSDGVFAIIITLLILTIQVPQIKGPDPAPALARSLAGMAPKFMSYALSFAIVCIWWVAHHHFFALLTKSDRGLLWLNSLFLFWLASVPFPAALLGDYPNQRIAVVCYGAVMALAVLLAWVNIRVALALYVAIPLLFFLPTKLERFRVPAERR